MKVVLTGTSGLLGPALTASFRADGHDVLRLVRRPPAATDEAQWDPRGGTVDAAALSGADLAVHLAGAGLGDRPWTPGYRREVLDSRVEGTATIAAAVAEHGVPTLLSMSGVGYYGNPGDTVCDEDSPPGSNYIAEVARRWEEATAPAGEAGARVVCLRTGVVLSSRGGAFGRRLLPVFRLGLGGRLGSGKQWFSWVSLTDYVRAVRFLADRGDLAGPVNVCAPHPLTNRAMTEAMGRVLRRPTLARVPGVALKVPFGDFAEDLLGGQRAVPRRLLDAGFTFTDPEFEPALRRTLAAEHPRAVA